jgi:pimeloyl-ACP methyl ester carboxylesterase
MESGFVEARGVWLHYLRWGAGGRPLVMIHGNGRCSIVAVGGQTSCVN